MSQKKKKRFVWIRFAIVCLLVLMVVSRLSMASDLTSLVNTKGFYREPENTLDVCFVGPSEFYANFSPTKAWEEFGFTSYSLALAGIPASMHKSMLKEVMKRQDPSLVVFEINGYIQRDTYYERKEKIRSWLDTIPWSENKIEAIRDLTPPEEWYTFLFPLAAYHNNWQDPGICFASEAVRLNMLTAEGSFMKGYSTCSQADPAVPDAKIKKIYFTDKSRSYLQDLLDTCHDMGLTQVLFIRCPHGRAFKNPEVLEDIQTMVEDAGYSYLNLNESYDELGLDRTRDFYNADHLNVLGMKKFTAWLGQYITDHFDLRRNYSQETTDYWNMCAGKTDTILDECEKDLKNGISRWYFESSAYIKMPENPSDWDV